MGSDNCLALNRWQAIIWTEFLLWALGIQVVAKCYECRLPSFPPFQTLVSCYPWGLNSHTVLTFPSHLSSEAESLLQEVSQPQTGGLGIQCSAVITRSVHERHPIARPSGRGMGCLLWVQPLIDTLHQFLQWCVQYIVILYHSTVCFIK